MIPTLFQCYFCIYISNLSLEATLFSLALKPASAAMHGPHSMVRIGPGCADRA